MGLNGHFSAKPVKPHLLEMQSQVCTNSSFAFSRTEVVMICHGCLMFKFQSRVADRQDLQSRQQ